MHGEECAKSPAADEMSLLAAAQDGPRRSPKGEGGFQGTAGMSSFASQTLRSSEATKDGPAGLHFLGTGYGYPVTSV